MSGYIVHSIQRIADYRLIMPVMIFCIIAGFFPLVAGAFLSFCSIDDMNNFLNFGSFEGYKYVLVNGRINEFFNVIIRALTVTIVVILISIPTAYWLTNVKPKFQTLILAIFVTPWLVSDMLRAFGWQILLSPSGPISSFWNILTQNGPLEGLRYNFGAVVVGLVSALLPVGVLSIFAAIPSRSNTEWLAAKELGHPYQVFKLMVLERAILGIIFGTLAVFLLSSFSSAEARFLDGPTQSSIQTIAASLVNIGISSLLAFGTLLFLFVISVLGISIILYRYFFIKINSYHSFECFLIPPKNSILVIPLYFKKIKTKILNISINYGSILIALISIIICWAPLFTVGLEAFSKHPPTIGEWTLENFRLLASSPQLINAITNSAKIAVLVAFITAILSFFLSLVVWNYSLRPWILFLLVSLVLLPGDAYAISLIQILRIFDQAEGGWLLTIFSHIIWALPFATVTLMLANLHISNHILEAGLEYSSGSLSVIIRIIGRINLGRIIGVALLSGTLSLNEYIRSSYLSGSLLSISNEVHGRLTAGLLPQNQGIFAVEFLVVIISIAVVIFIVSILRNKNTYNPY